MRTALRSIRVACSLLLCLGALSGQALAACWRELPAELAGFRLERVTDYEKDRPGLGYGYSYNAPGVAATVYLYSLWPDPVREVAPALLQAHFRQVKSDVLRAYPGVRQAGPDEALQTAHGLTVLHAGFFFLAQGPDGLEERESHAYLAHRAGCFLKLRVTHLVGAGEDALDAAHQMFVAGILEFWTQ